MDKKLKLSIVSVVSCLTILVIVVSAALMINDVSPTMVNCDTQSKGSEILAVPPSTIPETKNEGIHEEPLDTVENVSEIEPDKNIEVVSESMVVESTQPIEDSIVNETEIVEINKEEEVIQEEPSEDNIIETETEPEIETTEPPVVETEPENQEASYVEMAVVATAYCPCQKCCGEYAIGRPKDENGNDIVYNASGNISKPNHTIAVDTSVIPWGTVVEYNGIKYVAEDCGGAVVGNKIDIYFADHQSALEWGRRNITVKVYY